MVFGRTSGMVPVLRVTGGERRVLRLLSAG